MALGAAGFELVGALLGVLDGAQSRGPTQEQLDMEEARRKSQEDLDNRNAQASAEGAAYAQEARKAADAGNYAGAFAAYRKAFERSNDYQYQRDMIAMQAILHLQEALALTAEKKTAPAYTEFFKAKALAKEAIRPDIAERIEAYRLKLAATPAGANKPGPGAQKPTTNCVPVNGEFVCD